MAGSKYLGSLSSDEYAKLTRKLHEIQNGKCYICEKDIELGVSSTNIDHIVPLVNGGKDVESNFGLTHESCNKSKQDADLNVARVLARLERIRENTPKDKRATLADVLNDYEGGKYEFKYKVDGDKLCYSFNEMGPEVYEAQIHTDKLSGEQTVFIEVPIEYIFHDERINPRGINNNIRLLVKEFYGKNVQLHLSLARIDDGKIKVFDGQHKAVAQILLGVRKLMLRVFINPDVDRLTETNTNAGSKLKQVAFDKSIIRQLHDTLFDAKIVEYQNKHGLDEDDYSFSEQDLVEYFKGERSDVRRYIIDSQKNMVTWNSDLTSYIDFEGRGKDKPISYSTFEKTFLSLFIDPKTVLNTPMDDKDDDNPRVLEKNQLIKLCDILARVIYKDKFDTEIGTNQIEQKISQGKGNTIPDAHLVAYRVSKEEIMWNWLRYIVAIVQQYYLFEGKRVEEKNLFQRKMPDQLWTNIERFVENFIALPLWRDRSMGEIFSGKANYDYWRTVFDTGKTANGVQLLAVPINFNDMIV